MRIDLNADLGEGYGPWSLGDDGALLDVVTSANIACGFHAGDPTIMRATVLAAGARSVAVGAHPGYADLAGFGRRAQVGVTEAEVENIVAYQTGALFGICALAGYPMTHVKTHGALGNACADSDGLALAVARAIRAVDRSLAFVVMPGSATERAAERLGIYPIREVYADRTYADNFNLTPRTQPDALVHNCDEALTRVLNMVEENSIVTQSGNKLRVQIDSICIHGDNPSSVAMAVHLRKGLEKVGRIFRPATAR